MRDGEIVMEGIIAFGDERSFISQLKGAYFLLTDHPHAKGISEFDGDYQGFSYSWAL